VRLSTTGAKKLRTGGLWNVCQCRRRGFVIQTGGGPDQKSSEPIPQQFRADVGAAVRIRSSQRITDIVSITIRITENARRFLTPFPTRSNTRPYARRSPYNVIRPSDVVLRAFQVTSG
jgi:hypothetical protein